MKNITLSIDDDILQAGREYARMHNTSLNVLIRKLIEQTVIPKKDQWLVFASIGLILMGCPTEIETYTVTFDSNGGTSVASIMDIDSGDTITLPSDPTKTNNFFAGWYLDNNTFQNKFDPSTKISDDTTLYAYWFVIERNDGNILSYLGLDKDVLLEQNKDKPGDGEGWDGHLITQSEFELFSDFFQELFDNPDLTPGDWGDRDPPEIRNRGAWYSANGGEYINRYENEYELINGYPRFSEQNYGESYRLQLGMSDAKTSWWIRVMHSFESTSISYQIKVINQS